MRAAESGWRNIQALDIFVFHSGETSFGDTANESKTRGLAAVQKKHPGYEAAVNAHIDADPARGARIALDTARILGRRPQHAILCITHTLGGGIQRHINDRTLRAAAQGVGNVTLMQSTLPCVPCGRAGCEDHRQSPTECLPAIEPGRVAAQVLEILGGRDEAGVPASPQPTDTSSYS